MQTITTTPHLPPSTSKPWTHYLTLDLISHILNRSIFHPFICFLIPLCLLARHWPVSSRGIVYTFSWACIVTLYHTLAIWNHRLAYGRARTVSLENEVVLVAGGGGNGLGRLFAEVYAMKGVRGVAVLDVRVPGQGAEREEWEERGLRWFQCDVGRREEVERVKNQILKEFNTHPTILINCIAALITPGPIPSLTTQQFTSTLTTNLTSHFNLLSVFLPSILSSSNNSGGTIVTTSSILTHLPTIHLAPYSASKAALTSLHHTLTAEIRALSLSHKVKAILVEPGQIDTSLFKGVETPSRVLAPVLDTREVVKVVTGLIDAGEGGIVRMPTYAGWVQWFAVLPVAVQRGLRWASGIDRALAGFAAVGIGDRGGEERLVGRGKSDAKREESSGSDDLVLVE
ncbi:hypothetical protein EPUS_08358 [Endocarpon pusillum Z07020]|uniref:Uncharacterized protein n=1 Tax=Endocarpon pusillum (strain Z07020 / HMAS-L-300199) TaxID=1263415 RepID=U1HKM9_ENDPU|nr:uncharacterized protein EPUS_08358 [Endocarpon pusillum Z07020]ERF70800.1 hypothetical protein EPUS_08358 [Endocarpon pusillum Z07020]